MPRRFACLSAGLLLLVLSAATVHAFDGDRRGFVLSFSAGPAVLWSLESGAGDALGFLETDLKLGLGLSDRLVLYYSGKQLWQLGGGGAFMVLMPGAGVSYYLAPDERSLYVAAGGGPTLSAYGTLSEISGSFSGVSAFAGVGYEFGRHWFAELDFIGILAEEGIGTLGLIVGVLGY